jgi:hypothetical protein
VRVLSFLAATCAVGSDAITARFLTVRRGQAGEKLD